MLQDEVRKLSDLAFWFAQAGMHERAEGVRWAICLLETGALPTPKVSEAWEQAVMFLRGEHGASE